mgnify:CR=1 FL=1
MPYYHINIMFKKYKKLKYLNENGKLVKCLVYKITSQDDHQGILTQKINITYVSKSGYFANFSNLHKLTQNNRDKNCRYIIHYF